jgi:ankyrin repeat protein
MDRLGAKLTTLCHRDTNLAAAQALLNNAPPEQRIQVVNFKDRGGSTPLMAAVWDGAQNVAEWLVECGADVNEHNLKGNTALHFAYECSNHALIEFLVSKGGDQERQNYKSKKPLDLLDKRKNDIERALDAEKVLLQQSIPVATDDSDKRKAVSPGVIHFDVLRACKDGNLQLAIKICEGQATKAGVPVKEYVNLQDSNGSTGLMSAAWDGILSVVALYVELGADVRAVNRKRNTAMHFALEQGHYDVATYLKIHRGEECLRWRNRLGFTPLDLKNQFEKKDHSRFSTPKLAAVERAKSVRQDLQM